MARRIHRISRRLLCIVATAVTGLAGASEPAPRSETVWSESELRILRSMALPSQVAPPASASNRYANDKRAAALGQQLFSDTGLSPGNNMSCASCHQPDRYFTDGLTVAAAGSRNTPTIVGTAFQDWYYWDGRRDSLWSQALVPLEAVNEIGASRLSVVRRISNDAKLREQYRQVFRLAPAKINPQWPEHASPVGARSRQQAWFGLPARARNQINRTFANIGKAIAAYERTLLAKETRFDRYVASLSGNPKSANELTADELTADEIAGLKLFIDDSRTQCLQCHNGPLLTNQGFHNIGTGRLTGSQLDLGRAAGLPMVKADPFNCLGRYSDAGQGQCEALQYLSNDRHQPLVGAFKVPGLRNLAATAPYFHDGRASDLSAVLAHYANPANTSGERSELRPRPLSPQETDQLRRFLLTLTPIPKNPNTD